MYLYDINKLSNRDAPSLRLDFFHTKRRAHGSFLFYGLIMDKMKNIVEMLLLG